ncbi:alpha/beta-hydrolase [Nadsonia fulvescens var. elongata DSM 6958]|uniref:Alpha/beta-hydrolase n=1 Tax=Nadsonia fulvescens var. elongata DSM 6958 TaxID=857566 RepID=A0A1E3PQS2_9ASCO|nr:alpha/beta-hydrolase [Nadsonia fulvescens var. elongata DSM 6958]
MTTVYSNLLNGTFVAAPVRMPDLEHEDQQIDQFRGIQFAEIKQRFSRSKLKSNHYGNIIHAIHPGPVCPRTVSRALNHFSIPENLRQVIFCESDELLCLNLSITRPKPTLHQNCTQENPNQLLPVIIWIHGGGHYDGSGYDDVHQPQALVHQSMAIGKPVIVVSLQYRLGPLGWLSINGEGNLGLHDQRIGILWVYHFIADFGGDRNRVTMWGSGFGAADIEKHCLGLLDEIITGNKNYPFNRVISVGAPVAEGLMGNALTKEDHSIDTDRFCQRLNLKTQEELINVPLKDLLNVARELNYWIGRPVEDHETSKVGQKYNGSEKFWTREIFPKRDVENTAKIKMDALMAVNTCNGAEALGRLFTQTLTEEELIQVLSHIPEDIKAELHLEEDITPDTTSKMQDSLARRLGQRILERQRYFQEQYHHKYCIQFDIHNPFQNASCEKMKKQHKRDCAGDSSYKYIYSIPDLFMWHAYNFTDIDDPQLDLFAREVQNLIINFVNGEAIWSDDLGHGACIQNRQIKLISIDKIDSMGKMGLTSFHDDPEREDRWHDLDTFLDNSRGLLRGELITRTLALFNQQNSYPAPLL